MAVAGTAQWTTSLSPEHLAAAPVGLGAFGNDVASAAWPLRLMNLPLLGRMFMRRGHAGIHMGLHLPKLVISACICSVDSDCWT